MSYEKNHSAERRAPVDELPNNCGPKSRKRAKPYKIESRWTLWQDRATWTTHNRYHTRRARDEALRKLQRDTSKTLPNGRKWDLHVEYR